MTSQAAKFDEEDLVVRDPLGGIEVTLRDGVLRFTQQKEAFLREWVRNQLLPLFDSGMDLAAIKAELESKLAQSERAADQGRTA
jgi:hypothetical protein